MCSVSYTTVDALMCEDIDVVGAILSAARRKRSGDINFILDRRSLCMDGS